MGYTRASMKAIWNNIRAVDVLTERPDVDAVRIGVIGHSLGGHNAIFGALRAADQGDRLVMRLQRLPRLLPGRIAGWSHNGYMPRIRTQYGCTCTRSLSIFPS
ncbi:MAG: alpha/beta hydrolase family protein, partial [Isosphaeraceae bacterium]